MITGKYLQEAKKNNTQKIKNQIKRDSTKYKETMKKKQIL